MAKTISQYVLTITVPEESQKNTTRIFHEIEPAIREAQHQARQGNTVRLKSRTVAFTDFKEIELNL